MKWFYAVDGQQQGPMDEAELRHAARDGRLKPTDFVWNETMGEQWQPAHVVPGLFDFGPPAPPPVPATAWTDAGHISCIDPVSVAWDRMVAMLFRPFDIAKWFELGMSAWLATLAEGGLGSSFSWRGNPFSALQKAQRQSGAGPDFGVILEQAWRFVQQHAAGFIGGAVVLGLLMAAIGLTVLWLRSRGKFMFLDNVLNNRKEIAAPWREFREHGHSLFLWNVGYGLVCLLVWALLAALAVVTVALPCVRARAFAADVWPMIALCATLALTVALVTAYIRRFREDFVVPIMYRRDLTATEAWGAFRTLLKGRLGGFLLYALFYAVLGLGAVACVAVFTLATCCIGGFILMAPYVGAVLLLPVSVFFRIYSVEYLRQFGPDYGP